MDNSSRVYLQARDGSNINPSKEDDPQLLLQALYPSTSLMNKIMIRNFKKNKHTQTSKFVLAYSLFTRTRKQFVAAGREQDESTIVAGRVKVVSSGEHCQQIAAVHKLGTFVDELMRPYNQLHALLFAKRCSHV